MTFRSFLILTFWVLISPIVSKTASGSVADGPLDLNSLSDADLKTVTVRFERMRCYGSCPAYVVTIHGDGRVDYVGNDYVNVKGARAARIEIAAVRALLSEFARAKFLSLPGDYSGKNCRGGCTDMATVITELSVKGVTHVVKHYYGCGGVPKALFELEAAVDRAARTKQWTGDVSKQGPFRDDVLGPVTARPLVATRMVQM